MMMKNLPLLLRFGCVIIACDSSLFCVMSLFLVVHYQVDSFSQGSFHFFFFPSHLFVPVYASFKFDALTRVTREEILHLSSSSAKLPSNF